MGWWYGDEKSFATPIPIPWLEGWSYRKSHEINSSPAGAVTDYQMPIKVHYGAGVDDGEDVYLNGKCRNDFGDIRFTDSDGVTELSYWMEEKVDGDYAIFWVKVPSIPPPKVETGEWTVDGQTYHRRTKITITENSGSDLTDHQVKVVINTKWLVDNGYATPNGNEVRFTDSDGSTLLSFWRETDFNQIQTVYWVKVPSIPASTTKTIYIYYDEELTDVPDASDGDATFLFFDDFDSDTLNEEKWAYSGAVSIVDDAKAHDGRAIQVGENSYVYAKINLQNQLAIEAYISYVNINARYTGIGVFSNYNNDIPHLYQNGYGFSTYQSGTAWTYDSADSGGVREYQALPETEDLRITMEYDGATAYWSSELGEWSRPLNLDITSYKLKIANDGDLSGALIRVDWVGIRKYVDPEPSVEVEMEGATQIYIYYGNPDAATTSNGFYVFDFYEDPTNSRISYQPLITDTRWYGRPHIIDRGDGVWVMIYRDASQHDLDANGVFHIRFSTDEGETWTADDTYIDDNPVSGFPIGGRDATESVGDAILIRAPNGDLLCHVASNDINNVRRGTQQWRSTDGGKTWTYEGQINDDDTFLSGQDYFVVGSDIYLAVFVDPGADITPPYHAALYKSSDNGQTWVHVSNITSTAENTDEPGIEYLGNNTIIAVLRATDGSTTYQKISTDMGLTWSSLENKGSQLGVIQRPRVYKHGNLIYLIGRKLSDPHTTLYFSKDNGAHWTGPFYPDPTSYADTGYCSMLKKSDGSFYMLSYAGTLTDADIMEYKFTDDPPKHPGGAWAKSNITVSASDGYLRFYNPTYSASGEASRTDLVLPSEYMLMARYKTVSLGADDQLMLFLFDGTYDHRFAQIVAPHRDYQANWRYWEAGSEYTGGSWTEGTEFIVEIHVDESDSASGIDYYRRDVDRNLLDSAENKGFAVGSPVETDGIFIGDGTPGGYCDAYFRWIAIRKYVDPEPSHGSWGAEESV